MPSFIRVDPAGAKVACLNYSEAATVDGELKAGLYKAISKEFGGKDLGYEKAVACRKLPEFSFTVVDAAGDEFRLAKGERMYGREIGLEDEQFMAHVFRSAPGRRGTSALDLL